MTDMSKAELNLDAIEARAEAATPGPWVVEDDQFGAPLVKVAPESTTLIERTVADVDFIGIPKADFNAAFIAAARTDVPRLVRELREARRRLAELGECRAPGACQCGDDEACRFVRERDEARRELDEAKRTVAAASRYMFGRDEAIARAERSEAELEQLRVMAAACVARESRQSPADDSLRAALAASEKRRAELESAWSTAVGWHSQGTAALARAERAEAACAQMRSVLGQGHKPEAWNAGMGDGCASDCPVCAALASDCGVDWASPEQHAEVVHERDELKQSLWIAEGAHAAWKEHAAKSDAQLAEVTAQRDEARESMHRARRDAETWAEAAKPQVELAERVRLLEAVVETMPACRCCNNTGKVVVRVDDEGNAVSVDCDHQRCATHLRDLAALDAHDNQGGGK